MPITEGSSAAAMRTRLPVLCRLVVIVTGVQMSTAAARMLGCWGCWDDVDDVDVAAAASRLCICRADAHVRPRDHVTT